jgi:hypothetical protein
MPLDPNDWFLPDEQVFYPDWLSPLQVIDGGLANEAGQARPKPARHQHLRLVRQDGVLEPEPPQEVPSEPS